MEEIAEAKKEVSADLPELETEASGGGSIEHYVLESSTPNPPCLMLTCKSKIPDTPIGDDDDEDIYKTIVGGVDSPLRTIASVWKQEISKQLRKRGYNVEDYYCEKGRYIRGSMFKV